MPEATQERYEITKEIVIEAIASMMGANNDEQAKSEARKVEISYCSRIGRYQLGHARPISVTFQ